MTAITRPYDTIDAEALQRDADDCLLTYGTAFHPELITSTDGIYMNTQSGKRLMDFTSGVSRISESSIHSSTTNHL
jgi:4-aminobutyrate aminotransferase-like enzyme